MEIKFLDNILSSFNVELPREMQTMDEYLDFIIPKVKPWSEDLREEEFWHHTRWQEVSDRETFHEAVLHIFMPGGEYLKSIEGDIMKGGWRILDGANTFIWNKAGGEELFDLAFLNRDFFILKKHGDHRQKYFVMGKEGIVSSLEWRDVMEKIFNLYRNNSLFLLTTFAVVALIVLFLILSLL